MTKKAQVTVFIILGIIILATVGFLIYIERETLKSKEQEEIQKLIKIPEQIKPIYSYVESCIESTTLDALEFIGLQGGYFIVEKPFTNYFGINVPYYYYEGKNLMPSKERIEKEISDYIDTELIYCTDFTSFEEQGFNIEKGKVETKTTINKDELVLNVHYPLTIKKEDVESTLDRFMARVPSKFYSIYTITKDFTSKEVSDPGYIHLSYLADLMTEHDLYVNLVPWVENSTLFVITDNSSIEPYYFRFANKY